MWSPPVCEWRSFLNVHIAQWETPTLSMPSTKAVAHMRVIDFQTPAVKLSAICFVHSLTSNCWQYCRSWKVGEYYEWGAWLKVHLGTMFLTVLWVLLTNNLTHLFPEIKPVKIGQTLSRIIGIQDRLLKTRKSDTASLKMCACQTLLQVYLG